MTSLEELAFSEAVRAVSTQQMSLEALRTRAVALLGVAVVASAFLGQPALKAGPEGWAWVALGALALVGVLTVYILVPRTWRYVFGVRRLAEEAADVPDNRRELELREWLKSWACYLDEHWDTQDVKLRRLTSAYAAACVALLVVVGSWAAALTS